jgi:hypothetical protein
MLPHGKANPMVQEGREEAVTINGDKACRRAAALHGGKLAASCHDGAQHGAHKHRGVEGDLARAKSERKKAKRGRLPRTGSSLELQPWREDNWPPQPLPRAVARAEGAAR